MAESKEKNEYNTEDGIMGLLGLLPAIILSYSLYQILNEIFSTTWSILGGVLIFFVVFGFWMGEIEKYKNKSRKEKITIYVIVVGVLIILFSFSPFEGNDNNTSSQNLENILKQDNKETDSKNNDYCFNVSNEVWQKRCLAYKKTKPNLCEAFYNGNPSGQDDIDECYYTISINTEKNSCAKIEDKKLRWRCEAIATENMSKCAYSIDLESEIWCLRNYAQFYQSRKACDLIGQKEQEIKNVGLVDSEGNIRRRLSKEDCLNSLSTIKESSKRTKEETIIEVYGDRCNEYNNKNCSKYENEGEESGCLLCQAMNNKEPNKCFLFKNNRRDKCITALSLLNKDPQFCNERSEDVKSCINQYGRSISVDVCLNPVNPKCIISAVESMDESNQHINSSVCSSIENTNKKGICYVEYAKSSVEAG